MNSVQKKIFRRLILTALVFIYISESPTAARPSDNFAKYTEIDFEAPVDPNLYNGNLSESVIRQIQQCDKDMEAMELCMRCAKVTKSEIVYPMCCANEEEVKVWCQQYIYYGAAPLS